MGQYASSVNVSGTGWYVIRNQAGVSVDVEKIWYALDPNGETTTLIEDENVLAQKPAVTFDLYQATAEHVGEISREGLIEFLGEAEPVRTGITLNNAGGWKTMVDSLPKQYVAESNGEKQTLLYYYFALENTDGLINNEDKYVIAAATDTSNRTLTIKNEQTPVTVTITAENKEKTYGTDDPQLTATATVADDSVTNVDVSCSGTTGSVTFIDDGTTKIINFTITRVPGENAGDYTISPNVTESQGYNIKTVPGKLTINPAQVTVTAGATKTYGEADSDAIPTGYSQDTDILGLVKITGISNGALTKTIDANTGVFTYSYVIGSGEDAQTLFTFTAFRETGEDVGDYHITLTRDAGQGSNYELTFVEGNLTINPADAIITVDGNQGKVYGDDEPALTATVTGLQFDQSQDYIQYELTRAKGENVGTYDYTVTAAEQQENYHVLVRTGPERCVAASEGVVIPIDYVGFTITPASITITMGAAEKEYGALDPADWSEYVTIDGLKDEVEIDYTITRAEGEAAGTYAVTPGFEEGKEIQGNYKIVNLVPGTLTINKANLTIKANDVSKIYGDTVEPDLTVSFSPGLKERDQEIDPDISQNENVFTYTYSRDGEAELTFTVTREQGEENGEYAKSNQEKEKCGYRTATVTCVRRHECNNDDADNKQESQ